MSLVIAGSIPFLFIAIGIAANASCPEVFAGRGARLWLTALAVAGALTVAAGVRARQGSRAASLAGQLPAGLAAGLLIQPSSALVFSVAIAIAASVARQPSLSVRLAALTVLAAAMTVGYTVAFSPLVLSDAAVRC